MMCNQESKDVFLKKRINMREARMNKKSTVPDLTSEWMWPQSKPRDMLSNFPKKWKNAVYKRVLLVAVFTLPSKIRRRERC